jgi:hypothetical protein
VKAHVGGRLISGVVDCTATLEFVSKNFVRHFAFQTRKSLTKTHVRLANGQRVTSSNVFYMTFELARHEFQWTFYVLRDLRVDYHVRGLTWLDDEHEAMTNDAYEANATEAKEVLAVVSSYSSNMS